MKNFKRCFALIFVIILLLPIIKLKTQSNLISSLDNTYYPERPHLSEYSSLSEYGGAWIQYIDKRLGFREQMITGYQVVHDVVWNELVHPSYVYGKHGEVFGWSSRYNYNQDYRYEKFHHDFVQAVLKMKQYCDERGIYFIFLMEPSKDRVLYDHLPHGGTMKMSYAEDIVTNLQSLGVPCIDNFDILRQKFLAGETVFNHQYDVYHWNYLGAYYGVNNLLSTIKQEYPDQHINTPEEFTREKETARTLPLSNFVINEDVPVWTSQALLEDDSDLYEDGLHLDSQNNKFISLYNHQLAEEQGSSATKALFFQGSYLFSDDRYILPANAFADYTAVHAYQNILDFSYYIDVFKPDIVVFEQADYALSDRYFDPERLADFSLPTSNSKQIENLETESADKYDKPLAELINAPKLATVKLTGLPENTTELYLELDGKQLTFTADYKNYALCGIRLDNRSLKSIESGVVVAVIDGKAVKWNLQELLAD